MESGLSFVIGTVKDAARRDGVICCLLSVTPHSDDGAADPTPLLRGGFFSIFELQTSPLDKSLMRHFYSEELICKVWLQKVQIMPKR